MDQIAYPFSPAKDRIEQRQPLELDPTAHEDPLNPAARARVSHCHCGRDKAARPRGLQRLSARLSKEGDEADKRGPQWQ